MKIERKNKKKNQKGITLIALVVTIVVILILAGVTIKTLTGDNGILNQAQNAKEKTEDGQELEQVQLAVTEALMLNKGTLKYENLNDVISSMFGTEVENRNYSYVFETTSKKYVILENGEVIQLEKGTENAKTLDYSNIGREVVGITYKDDNSTNIQVTNWEIFDVDEENIYLISKNRITNPDGSGHFNISKITETSDESNGRYKGTASQYFVNGDSLTYGKLAEIANKWLNLYTTNVKKGLEGDRNYQKYSTYNETKLRGILYMLDTKIWKSSFIKKEDGTDFSNKVEYVMGGPTIEMLCDSYNKKNGIVGSNIKVSYVYSENGYNTEIFEDGELDTEYTSDMSNKRVLGYWLASPAYRWNNVVGFVNERNGCINFNPYDSNTWYSCYIYFRPIVCLDSAVQLKINYAEDGTTVKSYSIE